MSSVSSKSMMEPSAPVPWLGPPDIEKPIASWNVRRNASCAIMQSVTTSKIIMIFLPSSLHSLSKFCDCRVSASSKNTQQAAFVAVWTPSGQATRLKFAAETAVARARRPTESLKTIADTRRIVESPRARRRVMIHRQKLTTFYTFVDVVNILRLHCGGSLLFRSVGAFESRVAPSSTSQESRKGIDARVYVATTWRPTHGVQMFSNATTLLGTAVSVPHTSQ